MPLFFGAIAEAVQRRTTATGAGRGKSAAFGGGQGAAWQAGAPAPGMTINALPIQKAHAPIACGANVK
jgi:hypothetical protein